MKEERMRICLVWLAAHIALRASAARRSAQAARSQEPPMDRQNEIALTARSHRVSPATKDAALV
jgi:hypothetical protein